MRLLIPSLPIGTSMCLQVWPVNLPVAWLGKGEEEEEAAEATDQVPGTGWAEAVEAPGMVFVQLRWQLILQ